MLMLKLGDFRMASVVPWKIKNFSPHLKGGPPQFDVFWWCGLVLDYPRHLHAFVNQGFPLLSLGLGLGGFGM